PLYLLRDMRGMLGVVGSRIAPSSIISRLLSENVGGKFEVMAGEVFGSGCPCDPAGHGFTMRRARARFNGSQTKQKNCGILVRPCSFGDFQPGWKGNEEGRWHSS